MKILVIAPHNDDEILGVGGTIKRYINEGHDVYVCEVTSGPMYKTLQGEALSAHEFLGIKKTYFLNLPVGKLKTMEPYQLNDSISKVIKEIEPEIVFIPFWGDMHLDHKEVAEASMVPLRPINPYSVKEIYMYETLSETGWNLPLNDKSFCPDVWIDISNTLDDKLKAMNYYQSQLKEYPSPRSLDAIKALAMYRGATVGVKYAESFKLVRRII